MTMGAWGLVSPPQDRKWFFHLGDVDLEKFATGKPMCYFSCKTDAELIATGLLLGYPIESTASLLLEGPG